VNICLQCHADIAELAKKRNLHQPAFRQACGICHDAHGGERAKLLRAEGNQLCMQCHGTETVAKRVESEHVLTIFDGKVKLPEDYLVRNRPVRLNLRYGLGHPTAKHPVYDIRDPLDQSKIMTAINCLSCHQPHSSAAKGLLVKDQLANLQFCRTCHKGMIGGQ
jgi:predicted CXXCH cytochrome family protein